VRIVAGEPSPLEDHDALRVLGPGEWLDVPWLPADVPVVRALSERAATDRRAAG
jgi:8-oxo-dGTP diphosphatase